MTGPVWSTVCATGHRPQHMSPGERRWVRAKLPEAVAWLRDQRGMTVGVSGMALGTDMWWAADLVDGGVNLATHIPFTQQPDVWPNPNDRAEWARLRKAAVSERVYGDLTGLADHVKGWRAVKLLHARNDGMLAASDAVVAVWNGSKTGGGTASAVRKARQRGLPIVHLDPQHRTVTVIGGGR